MKPMDNAYELFYSDGGHGGPWFGLQNAAENALRLMQGCRHTRWVELRPYVAGKASYIVLRDGTNYKTGYKGFFPGFAEK